MQSQPPYLHVDDSTVNAQTLSGRPRSPEKGASRSRRPQRGLWSLLPRTSIDRRQGRH